MAVTETGHAASREVDDLYRRHGGEIYRYALAVLGNHADAEDVTQTTFLNAYRSLEQGVRPRKPSNWLLTIASNTIKQRSPSSGPRGHWRGTSSPSSRVRTRSSLSRGRLTVASAARSGDGFATTSASARTALVLRGPRNATGARSR